METDYPSNDRGFFFSLKGKRVQGPTQKERCSRKKNISPSIFEARCLGLEQTVVAIKS